MFSRSAVCVYEYVYGMGEGGATGAAGSFYAVYFYVLVYQYELAYCGKVDFSSFFFPIGVALARSRQTFYGLMYIRNLDRPLDCN